MCCSPKHYATVAAVREDTHTGVPLDITASYGS